MGTEGIPFWDTVVVNMAPIIIALTGFGAMIGGFWMQKRMMDRQNEKIEQNAVKAESQRTELRSKMDEVKEAANGVKNELVKSTALASHAEGKAEGVQQERQEERDRQHGE